MSDPRAYAPATGSGRSLPNPRSVPDKSFFMFNDNGTQKLHICHEGRWVQITAESITIPEAQVRVIPVNLNSASSGVIAQILPGEMIETIAILTKTTDIGVTNFRISDGSTDIVTFSDVDFTIISVDVPAKAMYLEYPLGANLTAYITGGSTFTGKMIIKVIK